MVKDLQILSSKAIEALRADHEKLRIEVQQMRAAVRALGQVMDGAVFELAKTNSSGITAMIGDTPGNGTITPYRIRGDGTIQARDHDETCYNLAGAVAADTYIGVLRDSWNRPWVIVEDCG
jgi:hypothetical protein